MSDMLQDTHEDGFRLKGWHVLAILLSFFAVVFTVNAIFVTQAVATFPGEDVKKSYVQGLNYNDTLAGRAAQAERGWTAQLGLVGDEERRLVARVADADGRALSGLDVIVTARRAATDEADIRLGLAPVAAGEYAGETGLAPGLWELRLNAYRPGEETPVFTAHKRITVP